MRSISAYKMAIIASRFPTFTLSSRIFHWLQKKKYNEQYPESLAIKPHRLMPRVSHFGTFKSNAELIRGI